MNFEKVNPQVSHSLHAFVVKETNSEKTIVYSKCICCLFTRYMSENENSDVIGTTEMAPKSDFDVKKLLGSENYHTWQFAMQNYLELNNLDQCIVGTKEDPNVPVEKKAEKLKQAKARLALSLDESLFTHIRKATTALQIWNIFQTMYEDKGLIRKIGLLRQLISVRLDGSKSMQSYVNEIVNTSNKLSGIGFDIDDEWLGAIMLAGLTDEYKPLIMSLEGSGIKITGDTVKQKLLDTNEEASASGEAFFAKKNTYSKGVSRGFTCYSCGGKNHKSADCRNKNKQHAPANESTNSNNQIGSSKVAQRLWQKPTTVTKMIGSSTVELRVI